MKRDGRGSGDIPADPPRAFTRFPFPHARELSASSASGSLFRASFELAKTAAREGRTVVLVEGVSDLLALNTVAKRLCRNLEAEGISTIAMGGATNVDRFLRMLASLHSNVRIAGLCDLREERYFRRALESTGVGAKNMMRSDLEALGFYVCEADLEDEIIRSLGVASVLNVVASQGEMHSFRAFQNQQAWKARHEGAQLHRWLGVKTLRKFRSTSRIARS